MKKIFSIAMLLLLAIGGIQAQEAKDVERAEKKALQAKIDSAQHMEAYNAIKEKEFTLEADQVVFKYGQTAYVTSNTNFVSVKGNDAVVQVAFNIPISGPNGLGGVTVDGMLSDYKVNEDKKGNVYLSMNVMGTGISARVDITLFEGSHNATVTISPNFNSNRLTLNGVIVPAYKSNVFQGRSL